MTRPILNSKKPETKEIPYERNSSIGEIISGTKPPYIGVDIGRTHYVLLFYDVLPENSLPETAYELKYYKSRKRVAVVEPVNLMRNNTLANRLIQTIKEKFDSYRG